MNLVDLDLIHTQVLDDEKCKNFTDRKNIKILFIINYRPLRGAPKLYEKHKGLQKRTSSSSKQQMPSCSKTIFGLKLKPH
jgi:hypothetical protein